MKKALLGLILGALAVVFVISSIASAGWVEKTLLYDDIRITLDGREIKPCDVNGNYIEPFIIEGTTYLPVRGVASSLGLGVDWDGDTNTVILEGDNTGFKSVLYDENGIKIAYNGIENTENGIAMKFFVQNDSEDDISFDITDISVNDKSVKNSLEYPIPSGKKSKVLLNLDDSKNAEEIKFRFAVWNIYTEKYICDKTEAAADSDGAELTGQNTSVFEVNGEITWDTFAEFFKEYKDYSGYIGRSCTQSFFSDLGDCKSGVFTMGHNVSTNDILLSLATIYDVYDPVEQTKSLAPVTMEIKILPEKDVHGYEMSVMINDVITFKVPGKINASDGSVEVDIEKYEIYMQSFEQKYTTTEAYSALEELAQNMSCELIDIIMTESKKIFDEKAPGLSLEFFGLK